MFSKKFKNFIALSAGVTMLFATCSTPVLAAPNANLECDTTQDSASLVLTSIDLIIDQADNEGLVTYDNNGCYYDSNKLNDLCESIDIEDLHKFYTDNNMGDIDKEDIYNIMVDGINTVNGQLANNELEVLDNGTIVESDDDSYYLQGGGSTYKKTYWWGKYIYKSKKDASKWVYELNDLAAGNCKKAAICAALGFVPGCNAIGALGTFIGGYSSGWAWKLANKVQYVNDNHRNGVKVKMPWTLNYSVYAQ